MWYAVITQGVKLAWFPNGPLALFYCLVLAPSFLSEAMLQGAAVSCSFFLALPVSFLVCLFPHGPFVSFSALLFARSSIRSHAAGAGGSPLLFSSVSSLSLFWLVSFLPVTPFLYFMSYILPVAIEIVYSYTLKSITSPFSFFLVSTLFFFPSNSSCLSFLLHFLFLPYFFVSCPSLASFSERFCFVHNGYGTSIMWPRLDSSGIIYGSAAINQLINQPTGWINRSTNQPLILGDDDTAEYPTKDHNSIQREKNKVFNAAAHPEGRTHFKHNPFHETKDDFFFSFPFHAWCCVMSGISYGSDGSPGSRWWTW